jgi:hypothetical protein
VSDSDLLEWDGPIPKIVMVDPREVFIDEEYQRPDNLKRAEKIAAKFDSSKFVPPCVAEVDGKYEAIDGNTRKNAVLLRKYRQMPVLVMDGINLTEDKAAAFVLINTARTGVSKMAQYKALATAQDPETLAIQKMFKDLGIEISSQGRIGKDAEPYKFRAIKIIPPMYRTNPELLFTTFQSLLKVYNGSPQSLSMRIVGGTFRFLNLYHISKAFAFDRFEQTLNNLDINEFYLQTVDKHPEKFDKVVKTLVAHYNMTEGPRLRRSKFDEE